MFSFNKTKRLLKKKEYDLVFKQAKKIITPEFVVLFCENKKSTPRLGLALSKKAIKKAHDRNRIKRLLRETFRKSELLPPVDIVVLARKDLSEIPNSTMLNKMMKIWDKLSNACEL